MKVRFALCVSVCMAALLAVSACHKSDEQVAYQDVKTCQADAAAHPLPDDVKKIPGAPDECQHSYDEAMDKWKRIKGYSTEQDCGLGQGTTCVRRDDGTWMSPMAGFVLGALVANHFASSPVTMGRSSPYCGNTPTTQSNPTYSTANCPSGGGYSHGSAYYIAGRRSSSVSIMRQGPFGNFLFSGIKNGRVSDTRSQSISERASSISAGRSGISEGGISRGGFGRAASAHGASGGE